jgi:hypothetical protein
MEALHWESKRCPVENCPEFGTKLATVLQAGIQREAGRQRGPSLWQEGCKVGVDSGGEIGCSPNRRRNWRCVKNLHCDSEAHDINCGRL